MFFNANREGERNKCSCCEILEILLGRVDKIAVVCHKPGQAQKFL